MNRSEHLQWAKGRAHEYLTMGDWKNAMSSMMSDVQKHQETRIGTEALAVAASLCRDIASTRRFIEGFK